MLICVWPFCIMACPISGLVRRKERHKCGDCRHLSDKYVKLHILVGKEGTNVEHYKDWAGAKPNQVTGAQEDEEYGGNPQKEAFTRDQYIRQGIRSYNTLGRPCTHIR
jgi:hypothetical protein